MVAQVVHAALFAEMEIEIPSFGTATADMRFGVVVAEPFRVGIAISKRIVSRHW